VVCHEHVMVVRLELSQKYLFLSWEVCLLLLLLLLLQPLPLRLTATTSRLVIMVMVVSLLFSSQ